MNIGLFLARNYKENRDRKVANRGNEPELRKELEKEIYVSPRESVTFLKKLADKSMPFLRRFLFLAAF